jgi:uncharacterized MAPEG superfamily protein
MASGNRDAMPEPRAWVARGERAWRNMLENTVLFVLVVFAYQSSGRVETLAALGATIFFWARLAYWFVYLAGIVYLRTALWAVGVVGMVLIGAAAAGI